MIRHMALAAPLVLWMGVAEAASTQTVWQGDAFITAVTDACGLGLTAEVGDYYRVVYRPKLNGSDPAEGLAFVGGRNITWPPRPPARGCSRAAEISAGHDLVARTKLGTH